jgi:hypothetical protein
MPLDPKQLSTEVIVPALKSIGLFSVQASELVLGTACVESGLKYLHQLGGGPALGLWQMEPATHNDIWENFLAYKPELADKLRCLAIGGVARAEHLLGCLPYAAAMCRVHYLRAKEPIPPAGDIKGHAELWKLRYNTAAGKGRASDYVRAWERIVLGRAG